MVYISSIYTKTLDSTRVIERVERAAAVLNKRRIVQVYNCVYILFTGHIYISHYRNFREILVVRPIIDPGTFKFSINI